MKIKLFPTPSINVDLINAPDKSELILDVLSETDGSSNL